MMQIRVMRSAGVMMRMQWRGGALLSRRRSAHGKNRSDKSFRSSEISVIVGEHEKSRAEACYAGAAASCENGEMKSRSTH